jgi:mRNA interferase MazF
VSDVDPTPGDIVWIDFSPTAGTEQSGRRPALVISVASYNRASGRALVAPITSRVRDWPFEVAMAPGSPVAGVAMLDQVRVVDWRARNAKLAGAVTAAVLEEARAKLAALIGRP